MTDSVRGARAGAWLWLLVACGVLTQATVNLLRPVTSYKLLALHADSITIGLTTAAYALVPLLTAVWLGRYSDRTRQLRVLTLSGVFLLVAGGALLALSPTVWAVVAASEIAAPIHSAWFTSARRSGEVADELCPTSQPPRAGPIICPAENAAVNHPNPLSRSRSAA